MGRRKRNTAAISDSDPDLLHHIRALSLKTVDEYRSWCAANGFSKALNKHRRVRWKEREHANRSIAIARLTEKKNERRRPEAIIEEIFRGKPVERGAPTLVMLLARAYELSRHCRNAKRRTLEILRHARRTTELLDVGPIVPELGHTVGNSFIDALAAMGRIEVSWIRPLEDWRPRTHNVHRRFASLARHLFGRWPIPSFMDSVWFQPNSPEATKMQLWFVHLGKGGNIRSCDLPIPYTKRMAHHFMQAPADFTVNAAIRWGQIRALGGNERLVRSVVATRLGATFEADVFWTTFLNWLIANPMLDPSQIRPMVDFIYHQKFVPAGVVAGQVIDDELPPPQPNFSMKGRTPDSLLRQVQGWHRSLSRTEQVPAEWTPSGITPFEFAEGSRENRTEKLWTIHELLSSQALTIEGRKMGHCVASYSRSCARKVCSIWSLELQSQDGRTKQLTIEVVSANRTICQARGKHNKLPTANQRGIIARWAQLAGLRVASHL